MKPAVHRETALAQCEASYAQAHSLSLLRGLTLHERERIAYANGERETHALILVAELGAEDVAADYIEEVDNDTALLADAKETAARVEELTRLNSELHLENARLRNLRDAIEHAVHPYTGIRYGRPTGNKTKPAPKWARALISNLRRNTP